MRPNPQFPADLVIFTEDILNGKLHFLWSETRPVITSMLNVNKSAVYCGFGHIY